jgi:O-6-methylguanine DNA methyltransferase
MINYTKFRVPLLNCGFFIASNENGVCYIALHDNEKRFLRELNDYLPGKVTKSGAKLRNEVKQIREYFRGERKEFNLRVFLKGTSFRTKTWLELSRVGYGRTISYSQLAELAGNRKAFRAAATSCARNPVPIIIPCHRVIAKDGSIGGFGGGTKMKRKMLELERKG